MYQHQYEGYPTAPRKNPTLPFFEDGTRKPIFLSQESIQQMERIEDDNQDAPPKSKPELPPTIYIGYPPTQPNYFKPPSLQNPVSILNEHNDSDDSHTDPDIRPIEMSEIVRSTSIEYTAGTQSQDSKESNSPMERTFNSHSGERNKNGDQSQSDESDEDNESVNRIPPRYGHDKQPMVYGGGSQVYRNDLQSNVPERFPPSRPAPEPDLSEHKFPLPPPAYSEVPPEALIGQGTVAEPPRTQVIINQPTLTSAVPTSPERPQTLACPHCRRQVTTTVRREAGFKTHMWAIGCLMIACIPMTILIYLTDGLKYSNHYCPSCQNQIPLEYIVAAFNTGGGSRVPTTTL